jgi:hypothetical protein
MPRGASFMTRTVLPSLAVASIGYLVPRTGFGCRVHSVFRTACNLARGETLLTVATERAGNGPTNLLLQSCAVPDLRTLFDTGETLHGEAASLRTRRTRIHLGAARVWRPVARRHLLPAPDIAPNLRVARARLAQGRSTHSSVIDREAAPVIAQLLSACGGRDATAAQALAGRLIGWGEGLTPAGDDFLVGLLAAFDRLAVGPVERQFFDALATAIGARVGATTAIAAHFLKLAVRSQWVEALDGLLDALVCERQASLVDIAITRVLETGATSGADTLSGVLAGLATWRPGAEDRT